MNSHSITPRPQRTRARRRPKLWTLPLVGVALASVVAIIAAMAGLRPGDTGTPPTAVDWERHTAPDGASWEMPTNWAVHAATSTTESCGPETTSKHVVTIRDEAGVPRLVYESAICGFGIPAPLSTRPHTVLAESEASPTAFLEPARVRYEIVEGSFGVVAALALQTDPRTEVFDGTPEADFILVIAPSFDNPGALATFSALTPLTAPKSSTAQRIFVDEPSFATRAEAEAFMDTPRYETLVRVLASFER